MLIQQNFFPGLTIPELAKKLTHREYNLRLAWLEKQFDRPERSDYYLMSIAAEVRRGWAKHPEKVDIKDMRLEFSKKNKRPLTPEQQKQQARINQRRWMKMTSGGMKVTIKRKKRSDPDVSSN